ncbi:hypothetical protein SLUN_19255 [Streptomyces lunaelactis]|uniref:Uncharacterized protein n=1 Tax=Streptomyces lunaelactis TaxID=1535768 RepID=A0A2R4TEI9_9ACTN|nr:hypothetical protein [Streptomyces lunaelactis]AVZ77546.1 hypothetical protein SLUN_19255 [Streptomyces lunaelactis]
MAGTWADGQESGTPAALEIGTMAVDTKRNKVGWVMGHVGPRVQLRPLESGREWDVEPQDIREASGDEALSARVAETNRRSQSRGF